MYAIVNNLDNLCTGHFNFFYKIKVKIYLICIKKYYVYMLFK